MGDGDHFGAHGELARYKGGPVTSDPIERLRKLEAHIALHPYGECTCGGEGECGWCQRSDALERVPKLEAEVALLSELLAERNAQVADMFMKHEVEVERLRSWFASIKVRVEQSIRGEITYGTMANEVHGYCRNALNPPAKEPKP